jgi:hypothetical protein
VIRCRVSASCAGAFARRFPQNAAIVTHTWTEQNAGRDELKEPLSRAHREAEG